MTDQKRRPSFRLSDDEIWDFVTNAHTGIMTTLRRDGVPISLPVWFACVDRAIYIRTRGKKLQRIKNDPRASFLVESGDHWGELKAVHLTGRAEVVDLDDETLARAQAETSRKYRAFRTPSSDMPSETADVYSSSMQWVRFVPDERILSWDNAKLVAVARARSAE